MRNFVLFIGIAIIMGTALVSCTPKTAESEKDSHVSYFRHIQFSETPWDIEKGIYGLTAKEAESINNYKFTVDDNMQLVSVEYNRNGVLLDYSSLGAAKITYDYVDGKQIKKFFNSDGEQIERGGAFTYVYTLNDEGFRTGMSFFDKEGNPTENRNKINNYTWVKLDDGMIQEKRYNLAGEFVVMNPFCPFYELRFSYDDKGYVVRMANYEADTLYNCTEENCGDVGVSYFLFVNNDKGSLEKFSVHNTSGQLSNLYAGWAKRENVVDENGYVTLTTQYDQDDEMLSGKRNPKTQSLYDEHGALLERISLDADGNIANDPDNGVAIVAYKYDDAGKRVETLRYDKDRNLVPDKE